MLPALLLSAQISLGILYAQVLEWNIHKYLLHSMGTKKDSHFSFHFKEHHRTSRKLGFHDPSYEGRPILWNASAKELLSLLLLGILHSPLLLVSPIFLLAAMGYSLHYYRLHKKSHVDPAWCRLNLPWHYDHHMGPNQHANWGVTTDWIDRLVGTREVYLGTEREKIDRMKQASRTMLEEPSTPSSLYSPHRA
jgi:sterol desaturase/sphingolipid hydroxylase (fatty acid hydroxylase superfamily)